MKKLFLLLLIALAVFLYHFRERIYLHDFVAHATVGGMQDTTHAVYINFANDLLLIRENPRPAETILVRNGAAGPIISGLTCFHWLACMTTAEDNDGPLAQPNAMVRKQSRVITFTNEDNKPVQVDLW